METIIAQIAEEFIKKIIKAFTERKNSFAELEKIAFTESKNCSAKLLGAYAAAIDEEIRKDRQGRREMGCTVQRRGDERQIQTLVGEVTYHRTYYKKASGGYEYLTDTTLGVGNRKRLSDGLTLALVTAAKEMSYANSSQYISNGEVSRQTVMNKVRDSYAEEAFVEAKKQVKNLHIDADEAHVTMYQGRKSIVPLISVYEGVEHNGKRRSCKNVFHISEYGKGTGELWEQVLSEIEKRYDLTDTKIYLHGDGGGWIQKGMEWLPNAKFVLDKYHKNKAIKQMTAGLEKRVNELYDREIREALENKDIRYFEELSESLCHQLPERREKIVSAGKYLKQFADGIAICKTDLESNNGGSTEPHVSHVLAARLSTRPMAWSKRTLTQLAPILAGGRIALRNEATEKETPRPLLKAAARASKAFSRGKAGLPVPEAIGRLSLSGKICGTQKILHIFA